MTNLSVTAETNVEGNIRIDYITILTTDGKEVNLNWEYSYCSQDEPSDPSSFILKSMRKSESFYENVFFDDEEEENPVSDLKKKKALKDATILEIQLYIPDFAGNPEEIKFNLKSMDFVFRKQESGQTKYSPYDLPIKYDENFTLVIEK